MAWLTWQKRGFWCESTPAPAVGWRPERCSRFSTQPGFYCGVSGSPRDLQRFARHQAADVQRTWLLDPCGFAAHGCGRV